MRLPVIALAAAALVAVQAAPAVAQPATLEAELRARVVTDDDFARRELYTWTTVEQVAALRRTRTLLVATASSGSGPSPFVKALAGRASRDALVARLLDDPALSRRRYAWTTPYGTVMPRGPRAYGDALVRIVLRPEALVVRFAPAERVGVRVVDMRGAPVPVERALAEARRIGAVLHVRAGPGTPSPFREYVVVNEAMVESWEVSTPAVAARVDADRALLERLAEGAFGRHGRVASSSWRALPRRLTVEALWSASLAFDVPAYRPTARNARALAEALDGYDRSGPPLIHRP